MTAPTHVPSLTFTTADGEPRSLAELVASRLKQLSGDPDSLTARLAGIGAEAAPVLQVEGIPIHRHLRRYE